jgi:hypothetical protein
MSGEIPVPDQEMAQIYGRVFGTSEGRKVLAHITERLCLIETPIPLAQSGNDPLALAAHVSARNIGLRIKHMATGSILSAKVPVATQKETTS